jgi:hypothetical protein
MISAMTQPKIMGKLWSAVQVADVRRNALVSRLMECTMLLSRHDHGTSMVYAAVSTCHVSQL